MIVQKSALLVALLAAPVALVSQAANTTQPGTIKSVSGGSVVVTTDSKTDLTVTPAEGARFLQLAPGSRDLKSATPVALTDLAPGDRVLVTGHPGASPSAVEASRIIVMKASAVADLHASQSADWTRRGTGGIVKAVSSPDIAIAVGQRTVNVVTTPQTVFRRYAGDSIRFEDARPGSLADIHPGDQLRVRGDRSADGSSLGADEIVSGAFQNIAGVLTAVDAAAGTVSLRDLATKKNVTVHVTGNSDLRNLPPEMAQMYARTHSAGAQAAGGAQPGGSGAGSPQAASGRPGPPPAGGPGAAGGPAGPGAPGAGAERPHRNFELSQMIGRLPQQPLDGLKPGQAVLIVASQSGGGQLTAITMLSGVESILTATPSGAAPTLSPWSIGSGAGEAEGGGS